MSLLSSCGGKDLLVIKSFFQCVITDDGDLFLFSVFSFVSNDTVMDHLRVPLDVQLLLQLLVLAVFMLIKYAICQ